VSNRRPPSVGPEIVDVWKYAGDENLAGSYEFPVTPWKTLEVHASKSDAAIVEYQLAELDIRSQSTQYGATLRQPLYESLNHLLDVSLTGDWRSNKTFLLNRAFDLSPGSIEGRKSQVFVVRTAQEYVNRSQQHVLALRSTFNFGLDAFDATRRVEVAASATGPANPKIPDGRFFAWLGQGQFVYRLFNTDNQAVLRANAQFADHPLLSLEQFSLGGIASVRGYRENQLLRDNGLFAGSTSR
jgi:hemolysin activation/secretion protein